MTDFERPLQSGRQQAQAQGQTQGGQMAAEFVEFCELRREHLIRELRHVEQFLIAAGRLKRPSLPAARRDY